MTADVVALPGDSVLVLDQGFATVFDGDLFNYRRVRTRFSLYPGLVLRWPDSVMAIGDVPGPTWGTRPFHLISFAERDGRVYLSLEAPPGMEASRVRVSAPYPASLLYAFATSSEGGVWMAHRGIYRIAMWTLGRGVVQILERRPEWFNGPSVFGLGGP